jgi:putative ABC transport system ATP-binding protein
MLLDIEALALTRGGGAQAFRLEVPALRLEPGARLVLHGASGSGKSTLLDLLALALRPDAVARFVVAGMDVAQAWRLGGAALDGLRARRLGYVLQTGGLLPFLTVRANIALPGEIAGRPDPARVGALARRLGIAEQLGKRPQALSVGQRQRVAVARAVAHRPALVLADEPTASVDPAMAEEVLDLLLAETEAAGAALVLATHDPAAAARVGGARLGFAVTRGPGGAVAVAA